LSDVMGFHDEPQDDHIVDSPPPVETVQEQDNVEEETVKSAHEAAQELAQEEFLAPVVPIIEPIEASDTDDESPSNPRKRKSQFRFPPRKSTAKKTATRASRRIVPDEFSDVETNEPEADDEQMNGRLEKPMRNKVRTRSCSH
jgi:hypothetical protein